MARLILSLDGVTLKELPLVKEWTTIGRKAHNDVQVDNLAVSGEHAAILRTIDDFVIADLDSTNGTFVNGERIEKHFLRDGDIVELGKYRLKYVADHAAAAGAEEALPRAAVRVLDGPGADRELELAKAVTTVGRTGVQVLAISRRPDGYFVSQVEGDRRVLVGGRGLAADESRRLANHDIIEFAGVRMEFFFRI